MSRENRLPDYLEHIRQKAADACRVVGGMRKEEFLADERAQNAVIMRLVAVGAMLGKIEERYPDFFAAHPEFSWRELGDACNGFLESIWDVDLNMVWNVVRDDLPKLLAALPSIDADAWAPVPKVARGTMKPSTALNLHRQAVREAAARRKTVNPRVFGSVLRGEDTEASDLDILVDAPPGTSLLDLGGLQADLEELLGVEVDVRTPGEISGKFRDEVLAEAQPV